MLGRLGRRAAKKLAKIIMDAWDKMGYTLEGTQADYEGEERQAMSDKHLWTKPHTLSSKTAWWYEEPFGIVVVAKLYKDKIHIGTVQTRIPWKALRNALTRKDCKP